MAKSGRTKQKEADLEYNVAKQVEKMLTYVLHSFAPLFCPMLENSLYCEGFYCSMKFEQFTLYFDYYFCEVFLHIHFFTFATSSDNLYLIGFWFLTSSICEL